MPWTKNELNGFQVFSNTRHQNVKLQRYVMRSTTAGLKRRECRLHLSLLFMSALLGESCLTIQNVVTYHADEETLSLIWPIKQRSVR